MRTIDYIPNTELKLIQDSQHFKMTSDSIHLCEFINVRKRDRILDIGCNNGVITMFVKLKTTGDCVGIDINEDAIKLARENALYNKLTKIEFINTSVQEYHDDYFDLISCNPPYHKDKTNHDTANFDGRLSLDELAYNAYRLLKDKGRCSIVIKSERLSECITVFHVHKFGLKRIRFIHHSIHHPSSSVCLEFIKNGVQQTIVEAPIINHVG
jgi:tRNA1(Val) A37 N6-methylase TrmN6